MMSVVENMVVQADIVFTFDSSARRCNLVVQVNL